MLIDTQIFLKMFFKIIEYTNSSFTKQNVKPLDQLCPKNSTNFLTFPTKINMLRKYDTIGLLGIKLRIVYRKNIS